MVAFKPAYIHRQFLRQCKLHQNYTIRSTFRSKINIWMFECNKCKHVLSVTKGKIIWDYIKKININQ